MSDKRDLGPLTFGFDIGIASVGWAVLCPTRIVDLGVRCFDKAETAKEGESLNLARRSARLMRRRLRRRAWRMTKLARTMKRFGLIDDANKFLALEPPAISPWKLRVKGLDDKLDAESWARVLYHLVKHRGFHWISLAEERQAEADEKGEGGKVKKALSDTTKRMSEKGYRTAAEMVLSEFPEAQRNKHGDYGKALTRILLADELRQLFEAQRVLENPQATLELQAAILGNGDRKSGLFWTQNPPLSGEKLLQMVGRCTFERTGGIDGKGEHRAPKASYSAERHVWLTRLTNLRITVDGRTRQLNEAEWQLALPLAYEHEKLTYKTLKNALVKKCGLPKDFKFAGLPYPNLRQESDAKAKNPEDASLVKLAAWHELRRTLEGKGLATEWQSISGNPELLDQIACVLSLYKEGDEIARELKKLRLPNEATCDALQEFKPTTFSKFHSLSLKALRKILPFMEQGLRYDEACEKAEYHHSQLFKVGQGIHRKLPSLYSGRDKQGRMIFNEDLGDIPRNPIVLRALNQARKVLNALVDKYGSPHAVHVEMARDLTRDLDERNKIAKEQEGYRERNEKDRQEFISQFGIVGAPRGGDFEKWKLYREQQGKCAYSDSPISIERLLEPGYVEIDHALPYSRSFDDSKNNKVLVHSKENRDKGNRTAYEYLSSFEGGENGDRWRTFVAFVESNKMYRQAKRSRLLRKDFSRAEAEEFRERNLNDTRYICKFFKNQVEQFLKLADGSESKRCVVLTGQMTNFMRMRWGLLKVRDESDRHHALDAVVVAACSHGMVKRLSDYSRTRELDQVCEGFVDIETGEIINPAMHQKLSVHFPEPWPFFRDEVQIRLKIDDKALMRTELERLGRYDAAALDAAKPLFVSRSVTTRGTGQLHEAKIHSFRRANQVGKVHERVELANLTIDKLANVVDGQTRNKSLVEAVRKRLEEHGGNAKKAFGPLAPPLLKPSAAGKEAPRVRALTLLSTANNGLKVRGGVAALGAMSHVSVYKLSKGYFALPRYHAKREDMIAAELPPPEAEYCFDLRKNAYVEVELAGQVFSGYFVMFESDGRVTLRAHDQPQADKNHFRKGIRSATTIRLFQVDVLGTKHVAAVAGSDVA